MRVTSRCTSSGSIRGDKGLVQPLVDFDVPLDRPYARDPALFARFRRNPAHQRQTARPQSGGRHRYVPCLFNQHIEECFVARQQVHDAPGSKY
jgi:hypothetical protein